MRSWVLVSLGVVTDLGARPAILLPVEDAAKNCLLILEFELGAHGSTFWLTLRLQEARNLVGSHRT